jgi:simple sugar transport system ATP-binding protein
VLTDRLGNVTRESVVDAMVGTADTGVRRSRRSADAAADAPVVLSVEQGRVSLEIRRGECVGLAGQRNSGALELAQAIVGLRRTTMAVEVDGRAVSPRTPAAAMAAGIAFAPEDRHASGFVPALSVADNATMAAWPRLSRGGFLDLGAQRRVTRDMIERLAIRAGEDDHVEHLSGGNQQKVMMARALALDPSVLVLIHPTAGVDIASKESLFGAIDAVCRTGCATLVVSDELDELQQCDRVLVVVDGAITHEHERGWDEATLIAEMEGAR